MNAALVTRSRWPRLIGLASLAAAVLAAGSGCGSRASDQEIVEALRAPATSMQSDPAGVVGIPGAGSAAVTHAAGATTGTTTGSAPGAGGTGTTGSAAGGARASTGGSGTTATGSVPGKVSSNEGAPGAGPATKSAVKIGTLGSFSGVLGAVTAGAPKTLAAWVAYTNAHGGLNGHAIKLIVADDQGDPATALTLAKRLVESDHVLAFIANVNVFGFPQIEEYTRSKGVPMIGGDSVDPGWATSTNAFPVSASVVQQGIKGLKSLIAQGGTRIGFLYCLEVSSLCSYINEETKKSEVGKYVVQSYQVSLVAPSYTSQCLRMKEADIDILWLGMDSAGAARAARDCANQGFTPKIMLLSLDAVPDTPMVPIFQGALIPGGVFPTQAQGVPAIQKYRDVMSTYGPSVGEGGAGAMAWASAELLAFASKTLSDDPTSAELYAGLWKAKNETLGGLTVALTFAQGKAPDAKACIFSWGIANSRWTAPHGAKPQC